MLPYLLLIFLPSSANSCLFIFVSSICLLKTSSLLWNFSMHGTTLLELLSNLENPIYRPSEVEMYFFDCQDNAVESYKRACKIFSVDSEVVCFLCLAAFPFFIMSKIPFVCWFTSSLRLRSVFGTFRGKLIWFLWMNGIDRHKMVNARQIKR